MHLIIIAIVVALSIQQTICKPVKFGQDSEWRKISNSKDYIKPEKHMQYPPYHLQNNAMVQHMSQKTKGQFSVKNTLDEWLLHELEEKILHLGKTWLKNTFTCTVCKGMVETIMIMLRLGESPETITNAAALFCEEFDLGDKRICQSIVLEFQTEVLTVIDNVTLSNKELCGVVFGDTCDVSPNDPLVNWNITLPKDPKPSVEPIPAPKPGAPKLRVLQISDIHYDPHYKVGSNANCTEPLCCRTDSGPVNGKPAGQWGDYRNCDTPLWTLENLFQHLSNQTFDYILWTGDLPPHDIWNQSEHSQLSLISGLTQLLLKYFPKTPIFPALGNHESAPVNSFPPPFIKGNNSISWLYDALATNWSQWLPKDTMDDIKYGAYYTVLIKPGFRIISINTNFCNNMNWWLLMNMTDPAGELQWLINTLLQAEKNHEKVHIIGHIPPGIVDCFKTWSWNYYDIVNRFESTITAQFFGHTHKDHFEVFYDKSNFTRPVSVAFIGPSVTPYSFINPGYRVYDVDGVYHGSSFVVLDHETYILNLTAANANDKSTPTWEKEYSAKSTYNMESLIPSEWNHLIKKMTTDDNLFKLYYKYYFKSHPQTTSCDADCKKQMICAMKSARSHDGQHC